MEQPSSLPGYQVVIADSDIGSASTKQLSVKCPSGKLALSAGWAVLDNTGATLDGVATYSAPDWDGGGWLINVNRNSFVKDWRMEVRVVCADTNGLAGYEIVHSETTVNTETQKQLLMSCPSGKTALGAGWGVLDETGVILSGNALAFLPNYNGRGWLINARNAVSYQSGWKLAGMLVCATASNLPGYEVVMQKTPIASTDFRQLQVDCPAGKKALGAGWAVLDETEAFLDGDALYFQPRFDGSNWLTNASDRAWNYTQDWKLMVRLLCG